MFLQGGRNVHGRLKGLAFFVLSAGKTPPLPVVGHIRRPIDVVQLDTIRHGIGDVGEVDLVVRLGQRVALGLDGHLLQHGVVRDLLTNKLAELLARHWQQFNRLEECRIERQGRRLFEAELGGIRHGTPPPRQDSSRARVRLGGRADLPRWMVMSLASSHSPRLTNISSACNGIYYKACIMQWQYVYLVFGGICRTGGGPRSDTWGEYC